MTDVAQTKAPEPSTNEPSNQALQLFTGFQKEMVTSIREVAAVAERGSSNLLLALGAVTLIAALFMKLKIVGVEISSLQPSEVIVITLIAMILLLTGAGIRVFQYKMEQDIAREIRQVGTDLLDKAFTVASDRSTSGGRTPL